MKRSDCLNTAADLPEDLKQRLDEFLDVLDAEDQEDLLALVGEIILVTEERTDDYWIDRAKRSKVLDFLK